MPKNKIIEPIGELCALKNDCCNSHTCCAFCETKSCPERCKDSYADCKYRTNTIRPIGQPWAFNLTDKPKKK